MSKLTVLLIIIISFGCNNKAKDEKLAGIPDSNIESTTKLEKEIKEQEATQNTEIKPLYSENKQEEINDFETLYLYQDENNELMQSLEVNWLSEDSIQFRLISENLLCHYKISGIAVKKLVDQDKETDENSEGVAYSAIVYAVIDGGQLSSIRIEMGDKEKAKIGYKYATYKDECDPEAEVIMKVTHTNPKK